MHEKGYLTVKYGSIYPQNGTQFMIDNMAMIIDTETGGVIQYGDINTSDIRNYYEKLQKKYRNCNLDEMANNICLITFDRYKFLNIDEICTLCNYFLNHIGERMIQILKMNEKEIRPLIEELQKIGF